VTYAVPPKARECPGKPGGRAGVARARAPAPTPVTPG